MIVWSGNADFFAFSMDFHYSKSNLLENLGGLKTQ